MTDDFDPPPPRHRPAPRARFDARARIAELAKYEPEPATVDSGLPGAHAGAPLSESELDEWRKRIEQRATPNLTPSP